jgi:predicted patatin/cPLA2 family phospholipase
MRRGLIMEGGAMRGMFTCGIIDILMTHGITFDGAIGVSAGAAFGCNYKSRQPGRAIRYNLRYCNDPRYGSVSSWLKTGDFYGADFCYRQLPFQLDPFDTAAFAENPMEFYVVSTDVDTGRPAYHRCTTGKGEDMDWIRSSASMPVLSRPVRIGRQRLLDGGCSDSIPVAYFESLGYDRNVVILTRPRDYIMKLKKQQPAIDAALLRYPALRKALKQRPQVYNEARALIAAQEQSGKILAIYPETDLGIGRAENNPEELKRVYELGRSTAVSRMEEIRSFLGVQG